MSHISREKPDLLGTEQHADCIPVDDVGIVPLELEPVPLASARLGLGLGVLACALELDTDERFVADDPRFVTGRDQIGLARADLEFGAVVVSNVNAPHHLAFLADNPCELASTSARLRLSDVSRKSELTTGTSTACFAGIWCLSELQKP